MSTPETTRTGWGHVLGAAATVTALLSLLVTAFGWPASKLEPRELPIAVSGPAEGVREVAARLGAADDGALEVRGVEDRAAAVEAIRDRDVYGAIVLGGPAVEVLTASAASPAVAQLLGQLANRLGPGSPGSPATAPVVTDVVPAPVDDPRGATFAAGALPMVLGGIAAGGLISARVLGRSRRVAAVLLAAGGAGLALAAVLQYWFGAIAGDYWANAGVIAIGIAAIAASLVGLHQLLGFAGLGVGAATVLLLGNPLSGVTSAPELLPAGWGDLGQLLPPGAIGSALRSTAFFDSAGAAMPLAVLAAWLVLGLLATGLRRTPPTRVSGRPAYDANLGGDPSVPSTDRRASAAGRTRKAEKARG